MSTTFDYDGFYRRLEAEVRGSSDFAASIAAVMAWCSRSRPHPDWPRLVAFDAAAELQAARSWLPRVSARAPCAFPVRGAYFGLGEFSDDAGVEFSDLYFGLLGAYDRDDTELAWLFDKVRHYPDDAYLASVALRRAGCCVMEPLTTRWVRLATSASVSPSRPCC
jgi:hypothetical protein